MDEYKFISKSDLAKNFVYSVEEGKLIDVGAVNGSYRYDRENYLFTWCEGGSYDFDPSTKTYTFKEDGSGAYKLYHTAKGSYERVIDEIPLVSCDTTTSLYIEKEKIPFF